MTAVLHTIGAPTAAGTDWWIRALCLGDDTENWFPTGLEYRKPMTRQVAERVDELRAVCRRCPVADACLAESLQRGDLIGVFGGQTPNERHGHPDLVTATGKPDKHFRPWSTEDLDMLQHLHGQGYSDEQIAKVVRRSPGAVKEQRREYRKGQEVSLP